MRFSYRLFLFSVLVCLYSNAQAGIQLKSALTIAPTASTTTPTAIPLPEVTTQAESAASNLRDIQTNFSSDPTSKIVDQELPTLGREIDARREESTKILTTAPSLEILRGLYRDWQKLQETLTEWDRDLTHRIAQLDDQISHLTLLKETWNQTLLLAENSGTPTPILQHVQSVIASITQTQERAENQRKQTLELQSRVQEVEARVSQALASVQHAREQALSRLFTRDSPPLWDAEIRSRSKESLVQEGQMSFSAQIRALQAYTTRKPEKFIAHFIIFLVLIGFLYGVRARIQPWVKEEPAAVRATLVLHAPIATALLLSILIGGWIYPEAPRLLWAILGTAALFPAVLILRQLLEHYLFPLLNALIVFFFVDRLRMITAALPLVTRFLFLIETFAALLFFIWLLRPARWKPIPEIERGRLWKSIHVVAQVALGIFCMSFIANVLGYVSLATLIGNAVLRSSYLGVILYAALQIVDLLILFILRTPPLSTLKMVERHRTDLWQRARWVLERVALILWGLATLELLAVRSLLFKGIARFLLATVTIGSISFSLMHLLEFGMTLWISFLLSRFIRFILEEDVYPRLELTRGLPYAISTMLHYVILFAGFVIAMGALGLDMTKFTILAGAFGVGLGFGLQTILNNFFSGLILLFERPIKVGDVIQIDDATGVVERIGIRASTIRTIAGAEVIIPNGSLISSKVTNWTFSAHQRTIDLPLSVAPDVDPKKVIVLLEATAKAHPHIAKIPAPKALVTKIGAASIDFEIHASTDRIDDWTQVRSDLAVAISAALVQEKISIR